MSRNRRRSQRDISKSSEEEESADPANERNANLETISPLSKNDTGRLDEAGSSSSSHTHSKLGKISKTWFRSIRSTFARRHFPHNLVESSQETKGSDNEGQVPQEQDYPPVRSNITEPISELPFVEPKYTQPSLPSHSHSVAPSEPSPTVKSSNVTVPPSVKPSHASVKRKSESSVDDERSRGEVSILSDSDAYDRPKKLITKTQKYYKKRPKLVPVYDDSEESRVSFHSQQIEYNPRSTLISVSTESPVETSEYALLKRSGDEGTPSSYEEEILSPGFGEEKNFINLREGMVFIYMVIPPDGGYGWFVMIMSFLCQLIVDGIILNVGAILPDIRREFKATESEMVLVASVQIGCYFLAGAFGSIMINKFAFRLVACMGAFITSLVFVAGSFSPKLGVLILLYSAFGGCSMSLIWCSSQLIVACYFERYRPLANGFACSGSGVGTIIFSFLTNYLVPIIGWRHMLRVQAGFMLLVMLLVMTYVEVRPVQVGIMPEPTVDSSPDEYWGTSKVHQYLQVSSETTSADSDSMLSFYDPVNHKCCPCCPCCHRCLQRRRERKEQKRREQEHNLIIRASYIEREDLFYTGPAEYDDTHNKEHIEGKEITLVGTEQETKQVNYGIQNINREERRITPEVFEKKSVQRASVPRPKRCAERKFMLMLSRLFDYHLFKMFEFRILVAAAFLYPMGFNIPFVYSKARTKIQPQYAMFITPAIGLTNFAFRIMCGFVAFKRRHWTRNLCGGGLIFGGCAVFVSGFFGQNRAWFQIIYGLCYGVAPAVYSTLRAIIYVKYLGLAKLTNAFGITALAMGTGVFTGTTIAGLLVGISRSYTLAFMFAGLCLMTSGVLKLILPHLVAIHYNRERRRTLASESRKTMKVPVYF